MTTFLVTVEYSGMKYTPQQLKQSNHKTASRELLNNILIIDEKTPLISQKQQHDLKLSDYKNISKTLFNSHGWREVMIESQIFEEIIDNHISSEILDSIEKRKHYYASNQYDMETKNESSKDEKAIIIHSEILDVVTKVSEQCSDVKNKSLIKSEALRRQYKNEWHNTSKEMVLWKGVWRDKELFDQSSDDIPCTVSDTLMGGISKPILESRTQQDYEYLSEETTIKHIGTNRINFLNNDAFNYKQKDPQVSNVQTNRSGDKSQTEIKIFSKDLSDREVDILSNSFINYLLDIEPKSKSVKQYASMMVNPLHMRPGKAVVSSTGVYFFDDLKAISSNTGYTENDAWMKPIDLIKYKKESHSLLYEKWDLSEIWALHYRNYLSKNSSVEIFLTCNKTVLLYFETADLRDSFCKQLYKLRDKKETSKHFLVQSGKKALKERKVTEKWMNWEISNFEYLMMVNIYANRSFNDLSHYPVLPWLHVSENALGAPAKTLQDWLRDLTKNMGTLGSKERLEEFMRKYEEGDCFENDHYHYGSHYSHPGIVSHYLIRLHPFTEGCIGLQDGNFDAADRLFFSINHAIENALNDISDVREVIPEFFFMPEMFTMSNGINLGTMQNGRKVHNVELPEWAHNDPHRYVYELK